MVTTNRKQILTDNSCVFHILEDGCREYIEKCLKSDYGCKMLAKSSKTMKNTQNIKNNYTKYSNITLGQTQYIVAEIEFE